MKWILSILFFSTAIAQAGVVTYRVKSIKTLTPYVDRYFDQRNLSFANIFCRHDSATLFVIDNSALDGKSFFFATPEACQEARESIQKLHKKCEVSVLLNVESLQVSVSTKNCR